MSDKELQYALSEEDELLRLDYRTGEIVTVTSTSYDKSMKKKIKKKRTAKN